MGFKTQVSGDFLWEMTDRMRHGRFETGMKFPACGKAAGPVCGFEHQHLLPGPGQISGTDQSIVPCSNDDRVVMFHFA